MFPSPTQIRTVVSEITLFFTLIGQEFPLYFPYLVDTEVSFTPKLKSDLTVSSVELGTDYQNLATTELEVRLSLKKTPVIGQRSIVSPLWLVEKFCLFPMRLARAVSGSSHHDKREGRKVVFSNVTTVGGPELWCLLAKFHLGKTSHCNPANQSMAWNNKAPPHLTPVIEKSGC